VVFVGCQVRHNRPGVLLSSNRLAAVEVDSVPRVLPHAAVFFRPFVLARRFLRLSLLRILRLLRFVFQWHADSLFTVNRQLLEKRRGQCRGIDGYCRGIPGKYG
jgi:hypothetical protein